MLSTTITIILPLIRCIQYHIKPKVTSGSNPTPPPTPSAINQESPCVICCSNLLLRNTFGLRGDHPAGPLPWELSLSIRQREDNYTMQGQPSIPSIQSRQHLVTRITFFTFLQQTWSKFWSGSNIMAENASYSQAALLPVS